MNSYWSGTCLLVSR